MKLMSDIASPIELTRGARAEIGSYDEATNSLARFLPNVTSSSKVVKFSTQRRGLRPAAEFRAWDTEASIGARAKRARMVPAELVPVSQKLPTGEEDMVDALSGSEDTQEAIAAAAIEVTQAVVDAVEYRRGQLLEFGKLDFEQNGVYVEADFDRPVELNATAGTLWSSEAADIIEQISTFSALMAEANGGVSPAKMLVSRQVMLTVARSASIRQYVYGNDDRRPMVSQSALNATLAEFGLPEFELYERKVSIDGTNRDVLDPTKVIFTLPEGQVGSTVWGPTAEITQVNYSAGSLDRAGIFVGHYEETEPFLRWARATATVLPLMDGGTAAASYKVL